MELVSNYEIFCAILPAGQGSKALRLAKEHGAKSSQIFYGLGMSESLLLERLGLAEIKKEIFLTVIDVQLVAKLYQVFTERFKLDRANHGIAFSLPLKHCFLNKNESAIKFSQEEEHVSYEAIFTIVNKGLAEEVMEAAKEAGAPGGTLIHGRGTGSKEKIKLFDLDIEPEKDIILILAPSDQCEKIALAIDSRIKANNTAGGIIFGLPVTRTYGLYQAKD